MTIALKSMVNCEGLGLEEIFQGTCFGHANIEQQMRRCLFVCINYQSNFTKPISKNALHGLKNLGKGTKSGPRCVWMWVCIHRKF